jgi:cation diffusion facilitator CzcD-associated flavoprotein CzcO
MPEVAKVASQLTVLQRTPAWVIPRHDTVISDWRKLLLRHIHPARQWYRARAMKERENFHEAVTQAHSVKAKEMREISLSHMRKQLPNRPDFWDKFTPKYRYAASHLLREL